MNVKKRDAGYCNIKLVLIFLVVFGHMIEGQIDNHPFFMQSYRVIYSVHMPLFLFLSGLFIKNGTDCMRQMKQMFLLYGCCQLPIVIIRRLLGAECSHLTPFWHLWYLLSMACMAGIGGIWFLLISKYPKLNKVWVKAGIVVGAVLAGCFAGNCPYIGRTLSLSRTICFLPYFFMGMFLSKDMEWKRLRPLGAIALCIYFMLFLVRGQWIPVQFLYHADSFEQQKQIISEVFMQGTTTRLLCYILGITLGLFLLTFITERRFPFTKVGAYTLEIYLLHAPLVRLCEKIEAEERIWFIIAPVVTVYIILFLYKAFQWRHPLYAVLCHRNLLPQKRLRYFFK